MRDTQDGFHQRLRVIFMIPAQIQIVSLHQKSS
jgi:hypothetical protein